MPVDCAALIYPQIASDLLGWYDRNARILPWRAPPGGAAPDPYRVWLSEIMLQQTTVAAVKPYFQHFTTRWPTVEALAAADEAELMAAWAGLGYYARARNLIACARTVAEEHGGRFPDSEEALRRLPGIGAYTAAAIAAIAFGRRAVVVDANVERVTARLFAAAVPKAGLRPFADAITPESRAGDFAQAMMDLGATICTPRNPRCLLCPLAPCCKGRDTPEAFPLKMAKAPRPERRGSIFWVEREGQVLLHRRPPKGLLGGMVALPTGPWVAEDPGHADAPEIGGVWRKLGVVRHVFTHFALEASVYRADSPVRDIAGLWWPAAEIEEAGLPTLFAKAAAMARGME